MSKLDPKVQRVLAKRYTKTFTSLAGSTIGINYFPSPEVQQHVRAKVVGSVRDIEPLLPILPVTVNCTGCGQCCSRMGFPPFWAMYEEDDYLDQSDPRWLELRATHPELAAAARQGALDGRGDEELPCIWLDPETKSCMNYEHRPDVCRDFEMGGDSCLEQRDEAGIST